MSAVNYFDGWDSHYANVYVFEMDLDISNGGFVPVNNDDDNGNTTPDKDDPGPVTGEDDLVAISLSYEPSSLYPGYIELKVGYSNNNIRVWTDSTKGNLVIPDGSNYYKRWPVGTQPSTLYVEGVSAGTAELWLLYSSHWNPDTPVYPGGEYNHDSVDVTVVGVDILYCFPHILMYTGDHAADTPTQNCVAYGHPSGGTYSWQCSTTDDGMLGIVSGQNTDTAEVKGVAASSSVLDAKITVTYTLGGKTAQDTRSVTVHRPKYTLAYSGYFDQQYRTKRNYFHPVRDQFGGYLYITGMPCDEVVTCIYGLDENVTSPGATAYHNKENEDTGDYYGDWPGGIAVKDVLGCPTTQMENSKYKQDIYVGGWLTSPTYYIYMQPLEDDPWPCIWKE